MIKRIFLYAFALAVCFFAGAGAAGLAFAAACVFVSLPKKPLCPWYTVVLGALAADIAAMLVGDGGLMFWGLLLTAAVALALVSLPRAAVLVSAAWLLLELEAPPGIYVPAFAGIIYTSILLFTSEKNCAIIKNSI